MNTGGKHKALHLGQKGGESWKKQTHEQTSSQARLHRTRAVDSFTRSEAALGTGKRQITNSPWKDRSCLKMERTVPLCAQGVNIMLQHRGLIRNLLKRVPDDGCPGAGAGTDFSGEYRHQFRDRLGIGLWLRDRFGFRFGDWLGLRFRARLGLGFGDRLGLRFGARLGLRLWFGARLGFRPRLGFRSSRGWSWQGGRLGG